MGLRDRYVKRTVTAQNQFTDPLSVSGNQKVTASVTSSALSATIVVQRKLLGEADSEYVDIWSTTSNAEKIIESAGNFIYRIGVKTGGFTSATALKVMLAH